MAENKSSEYDHRNSVGIGAVKHSFYYILTASADWYPATFMGVIRAILGKDRMKIALWATETYLHNSLQNVFAQS